MKVKTVRVDVLDINVSGGWWTYDTKTHKGAQHTIPISGLLVDRNDQWVILASGYNKGAGDWLNEVSIPAALVKRVRVLEETEV
jgi:hypothetical protein